MRSKRRWAGAALAAVLALAVLAAFRQELAQAAVRALASAAGLRVSFGRFEMHPDRLLAGNVRLSNAAGEPIADLGTFELRYSLRDLLPGGSRAYGLTGFDVERARIVLIRHKDGSYNIPFPKTSGHARPPSAPYVFTGRLRDVSLTVEDRAGASARPIDVTGIEGDFDVDTAAHSRYRVRMAYVERGRRFPVTGVGNVDAGAGLGRQHWRAARLPIARIVNVGLNAPSLRVDAGELRDLDVRIAGLAGAGGALQQHLSATATIAGGRIAIAGLAKPLRNVAGTIAAYGNGLLLQHAGATLAGVPIALGGGVFDLRAPQLRLTVSGGGDLRALREVLAQSHALPLAGRARLDVGIEGSPSEPLTLIALQSPHATYGSYAFDATAATVAFDGREADLIGARTRYGGVGLRASGRLSLKPQRRGIEIVATIDAPAGAIPYANAIAPGMALHATALAGGDRPSDVLVRGIVFGRARGRSLRGVFRVGADGTGTAGPILLAGAGESLFAVARLDRPRRRYDGFLDAQGLRVAQGRASATVDASVDAGLHGARLHANGAADLRDVRTPAADVAHASVRFAGTPSTPIVAAVSASGIGTLAASAVATLGYDRGIIRVRDATAAVRGTFADAHGRIAGVGDRSLRYDLDATVHSADLSSLAKLARRRIPLPVEGTLDAAVHVAGAGASPSAAGEIAIPEGAVNGLPFHDLRAEVDGSLASIGLLGGRLAVGSSNVRFEAALAAASQRLSACAPAVDLSDFNDFFDPGDMLAGTGSLRVVASLARGRLASTGGSAALHGAKLRNFDAGTVDARWHGNAERIATALSFGDSTGRVAAAGDVSVNGTVDGSARARDVDLARWLPMAGIALPVTGRARADVTVAGRYPDLDARVDADVTDGSVGRIPIERASAEAALQGGRGRLVRASLVVPHASADGSGTFGLGAGDPLGLTVHAASPDVAALAETLLGKRFDAAGALDTTARVTGTRAFPVVDDDLVLSQARYGRFNVPRASGHLHLDRQTAALDAGEVDLQKGRLLAQASVPIRLAPFGVDTRDRPVSGSLAADDVEAGNIADLLPSGTTVRGRVDGRVTLGGSVGSPRLGGHFDLTGGYFSGPQERVPIDGIAGRLAFDGNEALVQSVRAEAGGGSLTAEGRIAIAEVRDACNLSASLNVLARALRLDLPQYVKGEFDGALAIARSPGSRPTVGGNLTLSSARIPLGALYSPKASSAPAPALPDVGFDLRVAAGRDVRVVSPNVDVGVQGSARVTGTMAAPSLDGTFSATGGTVSFLRDFHIQSATASFDPATGIVPRVDATATTYVADPSTNVTLRVTGPATALDVAFSSDPPYDREQILGLLVNAQSLGAVRGVTATGTSFSASSAIVGLAAGQINTIFTRNLLEPLSTALGSSFGLQTLQLTSDVSAGLGINAVKALGNNVSFVFAQSFNEARRTSWSLQVRPSAGTQLQLTAYTNQNVNPFAVSPPPAQYANGSDLSTAISNTGGTNGIAFKFKRMFP